MFTFTYAWQSATSCFEGRGMLKTFSKKIIMISYKTPGFKKTGFPMSGGFYRKIFDELSVKK